MARKYKLSRRLTWALALEAAADEIYSGIGASEIPRRIAEENSGSEDDAERICKFQEQIEEELRQRAAKIRSRLD